MRDYGRRVQTTRVGWWRTDLFAAAAVVGVLLVSDVDLRIAAWVAVLFGYQVAIGRGIGRWCIPAWRETPTFVAFSIGSALTVVLDQWAIALGAPRIGWLAAGASIVGLWRARDGVEPRLEGRVGSPPDRDRRAPHRDIVRAAGLAGVALSVEWFWTLIPAVVLILGVEAWPWMRRGSVRRRALLVLGVSGAAMLGAVEIRRRPPLWWIDHIPDYYLYEHWSQYIGRFGSLGVGADGFGFSYHWLAYGWTGWMARMVGDRGFQVTTRVAPVLFAITFFGVVIHIVRSLGIRIVGIGFIVAATYSTVNLWYGNSLIVLRLETLNALVAGAWMLIAVWLVVEGVTRQSRGAFVLATALSLVVLAGKSAFGILCVVALVAGGAIVLVRHRRVDFGLITVVGVGAAGLLVWRLYWDPFLPDYWKVKVGRFAFLWQTSEDKLQFTRVELGRMALQWILAALLPLVLSLVVVARRSLRPAATLVHLAVGAAGLGGLCLLTLFLGNQIYFAYALVMLWVPFLAAAAMIAFGADRPARPVALVLAVVMGIAAWRLWAYLPHPPGATKAEIRTRDLPQLLVVLAAVAGALLGVVTGPRARRAVTALHLALVATTAFSGAAFVAEYVRGRTKSYARWEREAESTREAITLSASEAALVDAIHRHTDDSELVVVTYLSSPCPIDPWGAGLVTEPCAGEAADPARSSPLILEARIHRRMLLRSVHNLALYARVPLGKRFAAVERDRVLLRGLLDGMDREERAALVARGVDAAVIPTAAVGVSLVTSGEILFQNSEFTLVALREGT
jgi:hypothetical protein